MTDLNRHIGQKLYRRRRILGLTQQQVASPLGVYPQQVQKYENGECGMTAAQVWELAAVLQVPVNYFYEGLSSECRTDPELDEFLSAVGKLDKKAQHAFLGLVKEMAR